MQTNTVRPTKSTFYLYYSVVRQVREWDGAIFWSETENQHVLPFIIFVLAPRPAATPIFHLIVGICFVRNSSYFFFNFVVDKGISFH